MSDKLPRCGRIAYTNDLPVYTAFDVDALAFPGTMTADVPSRLNQALLAGELDISPISSAFWAVHADKLLLLPDVCIGADVEVRSIYCIADKPLAELKDTTVTVTQESATGRALFTLICRTFGFDPRLEESDDPLARYLQSRTPCVLIGDKAIDAAEQVPPASAHDLGAAWHALTGSGMAYAVWAVRREYAAQAPAAVSDVSEALRCALDWGLANTTEVIEQAQATRPRAAGFYERYYRGLHFRFDHAMQNALEQFVAAAHAGGILPQLPRLEFFEAVTQHV